MVRIQFPSDLTKGFFTILNTRRDLRSRGGKCLDDVIESVASNYDFDVDRKPEMISDLCWELWDFYRFNRQFFPYEVDDKIRVSFRFLSQLLLEISCWE